MRFIARFLLTLLVAVLTGAPPARAQDTPTLPRDAAAGKDFEVLSVNKAKRQVVVNGGSDQGLGLGRPLCFYEKDGKVIGCFPVTGIKKGQVAVQIPKPSIPRMKKGLLARAAIQKAPPPPAARDAGRPGYSLISLGYVFGALLPFNYDAISWDMTGRTPGAGPVWRKEKTIKQAPAGARLALASPLTAVVGIELGLVYRNVEEFARITDYDAADPRVGAATKITALSFGVPLTITEHLGGPPVEFILGQGIELDASQVRLRVDTKRDDTGARTRLVDYLSTLNTVGIRLDFAAALRFGQGGSTASLGLGLVVPVAPFGKEKVTRLALPSSLPGDRNQEADLVGGVNHRKSPIGLDVPLTLSLAF